MDSGIGTRRNSGEHYGTPEPHDVWFSFSVPMMETVLSSGNHTSLFFDRNLKTSPPEPQLVLTPA